MILHSSDRLTFGKYQGLEVGMVYLLSPSYIKWFILESFQKPGIKDLNFLVTLRVINPFGQTTVGSVQSHHATADVEVFNQQYDRFVEFDEIKYSGHNFHHFSPLAISQNKKRLESSDLLAEPAIPQKPSDFTHFIHSPNSDFESSTFRIRPIEIFGNSKNFSSVRFSVNNRRGLLNQLPNKDNLIVASGFLPTWKISIEEMAKAIEMGTEFQGQVLKGALTIKPFTSRNWSAK